ncbi:MAG: hypothetical protein KAI41_09605 [Hyphomicrobiaceae bacterium]|nr:hypothetical protein [Hyphomicrobiaceae bacterium]
MKTSKKIDLTPTWSGLVQGLMAIMEGGTGEARGVARSEFYKMARAADRWVAHCKAANLNGDGTPAKELCGYASQIYIDTTCIKERGHLCAHQWSKGPHARIDQSDLPALLRKQAE